MHGISGLPMRRTSSTPMHGASGTLTWGPCRNKKAKDKRRRRKQWKTEVCRSSTSRKKTSPLSWGITWNVNKPFINFLRNISEANCLFYWIFHFHPQLRERQEMKKKTSWIARNKFALRHRHKWTLKVFFFVFTCIIILLSRENNQSAITSSSYWPPVYNTKMGESRLVPFPTVQQVNLPTCSPHYSFNAERQAKKVVNSNFKVIGLTQLGIKPKSISSEADPLTTRPSEILKDLLWAYFAAVERKFEINLGSFPTDAAYCPANTTFVPVPLMVTVPPILAAYGTHIAKPFSIPTFSFDFVFSSKFSRTWDKKSN